MTIEDTSHLDAVRALLGARDPELIYPCIQDLIVNGLELQRLPAGAVVPNRQDVTQYLAAWSRHAGLNQEECQAWLMDYCVAVLGSLSRRTPAAIRHSTKSNVNYIYNSEVTFHCACENNQFKARCSAGCPVHAEMQARLIAQANEPHIKPMRPRPAPHTVVEYTTVKKAHREQLEAGLAFAREEVQKGTKLKLIPGLLEARGFKTRTGRKWTYGTLRRELMKGDARSEPHVPAEAGTPNGGMATVVWCPAS